MWTPTYLPADDVVEKVTLGIDDSHIVVARGDGSRTLYPTIPHAVETVIDLGNISLERGENLREPTYEAIKKAVRTTSGKRVVIYVGLREGFELYSMAFKDRLIPNFQAEIWLPENVFMERLEKAKSHWGEFIIANTGVVPTDIPIPAEKLSELTSGLIEV